MDTELNKSKCHLPKEGRLKEEALGFFKERVGYSTDGVMLELCKHETIINSIINSSSSINKGKKKLRIKN